jgi:hypothetical protein
MNTSVPQREIFVLAQGASPGEQANARGHLFEEFVANLLALHGYERPATEHLNNTADGIELDVSSCHTLTRERMITECKAYTQNVSAERLMAFYGKLAGLRLELESDIFGYFVAIPSMTGPGLERARKLEQRDKNFRLLTSNDIFAQLAERGVIVDWEKVSATLSLEGPFSDEALLITASGLYLAAKQLDPESRMARRVYVHPCKNASGDNLARELVANSPYAFGLPVEVVLPRTERGEAFLPRSLPSAHESTVVEVVGSKDEFEYQFPASPKFFVGRGPHISDFHECLEALTHEAPRSQILVLNAQSGWGKSSLALRFVDEVRKIKGVGLCADCRTAVHPSFVPAAMRRALVKGQSSGILKLPANSSFASVASLLQTLRATTFLDKRRPLLVFFDQFENVFREIDITRAFRDLAFGLSEIQAPIIIGFAWKTDLVAFTEAHPFQLRDDIRSQSRVISLDPFGARDIAKLVARLQKRVGQKIHHDLRERVQTYSQGLPWLFKKLAKHILEELLSGTTQDRLLSEALNVQNLFERDLKGLSPVERETLRQVAVRAPVAVSEAVEGAGTTEIIQTLLNQRFVVQIGERLDIYWDIFRDYLVRGTVPIRDSYILRMSPNSVSELLRVVRAAGGAMTTDDAAAQMKTSRIAVFNMARELRQLGILAVESALRLADDLSMVEGDLNVAIRAKVASALKRHRVFSLMENLVGADGELQLATMTEAMPREYPAVEAKPSTWGGYARSFAHWLQYAGLATLEKEKLNLGRVPLQQLNLLEPKRYSRPKKLIVFPRSPYGPVERLLHALHEGMSNVSGVQGAELAVREASYLALIERDRQRQTVSLTPLGKKLAAANGKRRCSILGEVLERERTFCLARELVLADPATSPLAIGRAVASDLKIQWSDSMAHSAGKHLRGWLRAAGVVTRQK